MSADDTTTTAAPPGPSPDLPEAERNLVAAERHARRAVRNPFAYPSVPARFLRPLLAEYDRRAAIEAAARGFVEVANEGPLVDDAAALLALRRALGVIDG